MLHTLSQLEIVQYDLHMIIALTRLFDVVCVGLLSLGNVFLIDLQEEGDFELVVTVPKQSHRISNSLLHIE